VFTINIQNDALLVLLSTFIGSVVVVASYHEYRSTLVRVPGTKKTKAKGLPSAPVMQPAPVQVAIPAPATAVQPEDKSSCDDGIPAFELTMFAPEVLKKVEELHVDEDIQDEILNELKDIPPEQRLKYIEDVFSENIDFDAAY
nr:hypothetical protein [Candidatus Sigynarchaeota archaeon]